METLVTVYLSLFIPYVITFCSLLPASTFFKVETSNSLQVPPKILSLFRRRKRKVCRQEMGASNYRYPDYQQQSRCLLLRYVFVLFSLVVVTDLVWGPELLVCFYPRWQGSCKLSETPLGRLLKFQHSLNGSFTHGIWHHPSSQERTRKVKSSLELPW